ncbi:MAG: cytochrome c biogenesis protein CcsA [Urechidicola sp.]|nr:cytochrome c biogenesis protein CcsA [Urechidicola sp.]
MIYKILSSYLTMFLLLIILAIGAAVGTFLENDFGNAYAKNTVYTSWWYQTLLFLSAFNLILIFVQLRKSILKPGPIFHFAFVIILIGAFITHHFGIEGTMHIREGQKSNTFTIENKQIVLPFFVELNDFTLKRYPGSRAPSEFNSDVTVIDVENAQKFETKIYMNNTLTYKGFKFFQTSYDEDEKGTFLSVNKDPGVIITYIGYALLFLGLILTLFDPKSRIRFLLLKLHKMPIAILVFTISVVPNLYSQQYNYDNYLVEHKENSKELAEELGKIIVQGPTGRMKPLDTQNKEVLYKLTGKGKWNGMDANQVVLGMFTRPEIWKNVYLIRVKTPKLRKLLNVDENQKLVPFNVFFDERGQFKFTEEAEKASKMAPSKRGTFERDIIQVDELLNIAFMSFRGMLINVFPKPDSPNNEWVNLPALFMELDTSELQKKSMSFLDKVYARDYQSAITDLNYIKNYQLNNGEEVIPSQSRIDAELWYNDMRIFIKLSVAYLLIGLLLVFYSLISMFYNKMLNPKVRIIMNSVVLILFLSHSFGIALRWFIGGYAPISNTYETMVYIAYSSVLAGILFFRKSIIGLGAALIMAGVFVFSAYLGEINPQITSLVPVLKSYWLSIHVSVITASYGFFGVSAILGFLTLIIYLLRNTSRPHLDVHIQNITYINEVTVIIGLILLTIGNFLGGIWANESWGRYWGWDPKETWTYISIIVYTIVLHLRFIKNIYSHYIFNVGTVISFFSILMTYYGVNYYLSGLHSYATGDPAPMPTWLYIMIGIIVVTIILSYNKRIIKNKI